jgi:NAD(P)-dependent dehydrogenase (short-subunit alcohol dehydrogenase family)
MSELDGQVALVTGGSRGLGRGIVEVLAERGADVAINYHARRDAADDAAGHVRSLGRRAMVVQADVSRAEDVRRMFDAIDAEFGRIDHLVNNAGTTQDKDIFAMTEEDWRWIIDTNLTSCFLCCRPAMERMKAAGSGRIVNISSVVGHRGAQFGHLHYAATKSGMFGLTKTLARTGAPLGINVNCIAPGVIETDLIHQTHGQKVREIAASIPLGLGVPRDVGLAVAFLCGAGGRYITGATIDVNGGMYLR